MSESAAGSPPPARTRGSHRLRSGLIRDRRVQVAAVGVVVAATVAVSTTAFGGESSDDRDVVPLGQVVPAPVEVTPDADVTFELEADDAIYATADADEARAAADFLAGLLRTPTGFDLPVEELPEGEEPDGGIALILGGENEVEKKAGYELDVTDDAVTIRADDREGLFNGVATLRQLLPWQVESKKQIDADWVVQGGEINDHPRYDYRGAMLDVARNFRPVADVKRYIDTIARYKINYFHLHLTDDQGWRIQIDSWPDLTEIGGSSGIGGVSSGYYTKEDYQEIVDYAWARGITVVPEIEGPSHAHAALASYAELNCDGVAPPLYTDLLVSPDGTFCLEKDITYEFLDDVIGELAEMTPGPYIHVGGDESEVSEEAMTAYFDEVNAIVESHDKQPIGWQESSGNMDPATSMTQLWASGLNDEEMIEAAEAGQRVIMSPSSNAYIDMKYTEDMPEYPLGNIWAGTIDVPKSYDWQPDAILEGLPADAIAGVEAPLWTETVFGINQAELLAFPRLLAIAEIGWSPKATHDWDSFEPRLAAQGPRLREARVNYYLAPSVNWPHGS